MHQLKVKSRTGFLVRLLVISLFCMFGSAWFFYDAAIGYPAQAVRANKHLEFKNSGKDDWRQQWAEYATEQGWSADDPGAPKTEGDIFSQYMFGAIFAPIGPIFLFFFIRAKLRWIELTETGIRTSWGQELKFEEILCVDKKLWKKKGIARVIYEQDGRKQRLTLDDWKYETEPTRDVMWEVEEHLQDDQIINGIRDAYEQEEEEYEEEEVDESQGDSETVGSAESEEAADSQERRDQT